MNHCFQSANILLPDFTKVDAHRWALVACDQFTSEPEYWEDAAAIVGDAPSTLRRQMISEPLAYLHLCWTPGLMIRQAGPQSHGGSPQVLSQVLAAGDQGWGAWKATGALPSGHTVHHSPGQGALPARARLGQCRSLWPPSGEAT